MNTKDNLVVLRGGGDLATGIVNRLHSAGFPVVILETEEPTVIRRTVAYASAVFYGTFSVEGTEAVTVTAWEEAQKLLHLGKIPLFIDPMGERLSELRPHILVDAILAKKNLGTSLDMAPIVIGVGPGFEAGKDVHAVVETNRGHHLGRVYHQGSAEPDTGVPGVIGGFDYQRVLRAPVDGVIRNHKTICDQVKAGDLIASVEGIPIYSQLDGVLRGLIMDGMTVSRDLKIGDVDPRCQPEYCYSISDKARAIGGGVLESILYYLSKESENRYVYSECE